MARKRHKPEEIVAKLRQVDVLTAQGTSVAEAVRSIGIIAFRRARTSPPGFSTAHVPTLISPTGISSPPGRP